MNKDSHGALIFEASQRARERLTQILLDQGFSDEKIYHAKNFEEFSQRLNESSVHIVFVDFSQWTASLDKLIKTIKNAEKDLEIFIVLICTLCSRETLFQAANLGIHYFIPRPYKNEKIRYCIQFYFENFSSKYAELIKISKKLISQGALEEARKKLLVAQTLNNSPLEAIYFQSKIDILESKIDDAIKKLNQCLEINDMHRDSLSDLLELLVKKKIIDQAYEIGKTLIMNYPLEENKIQKIIRLCVQNKSYDEMIQIHQAIFNYKEQTDDVINYLGSGLYIAGKNSLMQKKPEQAQVCFDFIANNCSQFSKFIRAFILIWVEYGKSSHAKKYIDLIEDNNSVDKRISQFAIDQSELNDLSVFLKELKSLHKTTGSKELLIFAERFLRLKGMYKEGLLNF